MCPSGVNDHINNVYDAMWLTVVTMVRCVSLFGSCVGWLLTLALAHTLQSGVGYGDTSPQTLLGRVVVTLGAILGGAILACVLRVVLIDSLMITDRERIVLYVVDFHAWSRKRKQYAVLLLQAAARYRRQWRKTKPKTKPNSSSTANIQSQDARRGSTATKVRDQNAFKKAQLRLFR